MEVKTRSGPEYGSPEESVTAAKRDSLRRTAFAFLEERGLAGRPFRIDVIAIAGGADGRPRLRHFRSAVGEQG